METNECYCAGIGSDGTIDFTNQIFEMPAWHIDPYDTERLINKLKMYLTFA